MRVGIYNRWLHTLGGGEREVAAMAQVLQHDHHIELLAHQPIDLRLFEARLGADLPSVGLRVLPDDPDYAHVVTASADYDLFFNMSHDDLFVPRAGRNLLRVFFPARPEVAVPPADSPPVMLLGGFYRPETADRPFAWTGPLARLALHPPARSGQDTLFDLELTLHGWRPAGAPSARVELRLDSSIVARRELPRDGAWTTWRVRLPSASRNITLATTTFNSRGLGLGDDNRDLGVALAAVRLVPRRRWFAAKDGATGIMLDEHAWAARPPRPVREIAAAYDRLLANSRFTQRWIERRWGLSSEVLYPPIEVHEPGDGRREPVVLSIGRFFAGGHNKKHLPMIGAFRALCDAGLDGWEYHLAGGCDLAMPEHRAYLEEVRAAAAGYPISVHVNATREELRKLTTTARIFWHATGLDEDEEQAPERFEHFGITTVEAMAAGCVPVVIARGGQVEIVEHGVSGLLWQTLPELQAHTRALIDDPALLARLSMGARQRSRLFGLDRFTRDVLALLEDSPR